MSEGVGRLVLTDLQSACQSGGYDEITDLMRL